MSAQSCSFAQSPGKAKQQTVNSDSVRVNNKIKTDITILHKLINHSISFCITRFLECYVYVCKCEFSLICINIQNRNQNIG